MKSTSRFYVNVSLLKVISHHYVKYVAIHVLVLYQLYVVLLGHCISSCLSVQFFQIYLVQFIRLVMLVPHTQYSQSIDNILLRLYCFIQVRTINIQLVVSMITIQLSSILVNLLSFEDNLYVLFPLFMSLFRQLELVGGLSQQLILIKVFRQ